MESAYKEAISVEWKSMIGRFKCLYWLCKEEVAHTTKFESLLELGKPLGVEYLDAVCQGGNAQYTSRGVFQEALQALVDDIQVPIYHAVKESHAILC